MTGISVVILNSLSNSDFGVDSVIADLVTEGKLDEYTFAYIGDGSSVADNIMFENDIEELPALIFTDTGTTNVLGVIEVPNGTNKNQIEHILKQIGNPRTIGEGLDVFTNKKINPWIIVSIVLILILILTYFLTRNK